jgi:beta-lactamase superfamily II metal-dependent hydrolase
VGLIARRSAGLLAAILLLGACALPADSGAAPDTPSSVPSPVPAPGPEPAPAPSPEPAPAPSPEPAPPGLLEVHFLDVGQGDATLLIHPDVTVLIDTGRFDRRDVAPLLRARGVTRIDLLVVTHPHADHIGQFDRVMSAFDVTEVWWSGSSSTSATFGRALAALEASDARYEEPRAGATTRVGPLTIDVLAPGSGDSLTDLNNASIALRITYGSFALVTTGDAEAPSEARMLARVADRLPAQVLRLGHHGSSTSTTAAFLAAVAPQVAIYSAGAGNQYGHPHTETVERVAGAGIPLYGTAVHGTVTLISDGVTFEIRTER